MSLPPGWRNHLVATVSAVRASVERFERIASDGISPGGQTLTPLPTEQWEPIHEILAGILAEMEELADALTYEETHRARERRPLKTTCFYLSLALMELEQEIIADIDQNRPSRYGEIQQQDHDRIDTSVKSVQAQITQIKALIGLIHETSSDLI